MFVPLKLSSIFYLLLILICVGCSGNNNNRTPAADNPGEDQPGDPTEENQPNLPKSDDLGDANNHHEQNKHKGVLIVQSGSPQIQDNRTKFKLSFERQGHETLLSLVTAQKDDCLSISNFTEHKGVPGHIDIDVAGFVDGPLFLCIQPVTAGKPVDMTVIPWTKDTTAPELSYEIEGGKKGQPYTFKATTEADAKVDWEIEGGTTSSHKGHLVTFIAKADGMYEVELISRDLAGNKTKKTFQVEVDTIPPVVEMQEQFFFGSSVADLSTNGPFPVQIPASIEGATKIQWSTESNLLELTQANKPTPTLNILKAPKSAGTQSFEIKVEATDAFENKTTKNATVKFNFWEPDFSGQMEKLAAKKFQFKESQVAPEIIGYEWAFKETHHGGTIENATSLNAIFEFVEDGNYAVTVTIENNVNEKFVHEFNMLVDTTPPEIVDIEVNFNSNVLSRYSNYSEDVEPAQHGWNITLTTSEPITGSGFIVVEKSIFDRCYQYEPATGKYLGQPEISGCWHDPVDGVQVLTGSLTNYDEMVDPNKRAAHEFSTSRNDVYIDGKTTRGMATFDPNKTYLALLCSKRKVYNNGTQNYERVPNCKDLSGNLGPIGVKEIQFKQRSGLDTILLADTFPAEDGEYNFSEVPSFYGGNILPIASFQSMYLDSENRDLGIVSRLKSPANGEKIIVFPDLSDTTTFKTFEIQHQSFVLALNESNQPNLFIIKSVRDGTGYYPDISIYHYSADDLNRSDLSNFDELGLGTKIAEKPDYSPSSHQCFENLDPVSGQDDLWTLFLSYCQRLTTDEDQVIDEDVSMKRLRNLDTINEYVSPFHFFRKLKHKPAFAETQVERIHFDAVNFPALTHYTVPQKRGNDVIFYGLKKYQDHYKIWRHLYKSDFDE